VTLQKRQAALMAAPQHPVTPDGQYFVVRGKLWRMANPNLAPAKKAALVNELMKARNAVRSPPSLRAIRSRRRRRITLSYARNGIPA